MLIKREKENLFRYRALLEGNLQCFARACANVRALMTRESCAVGMRNAILNNYLKGPDTRCNIARNIARNIFYSTWLHGRNISYNVTRNI